MKSVIDFSKRWLIKIREWMKPDPADHLLLQIAKMLFKCIALLVLIAFSPVIIVVLLFVFLAAV
jgi:hypothetical protein